MRGKPEGLYLWTRHSSDCKFASVGVDRDQSRRCNCVRYIGGTATDGAQIRESTGTTSWEKARKVVALKIAEHDPLTKRFLGMNAVGEQTSATAPSIADAIDAFIETKRGESVSDMTHYEGLFNREFLPWCKERGLFEVREISLDQVTRFRNQLKNKPTVKNRKLSRIRSFLAFCLDRRWANENAARKLKPAREDEPEVDYFHPDEMEKLLDACFTSHDWVRGRDFEYRDRRLRALLLFLRWTGLSIIDCIRFEKHRLSKNEDGVWSVLLRRMKNGNPVFVAIPPQVTNAVLEIPGLSDEYFFWSGNGKPQTAVRGWRRSLAKVFKAAKIKRNNKPIRCHPHMLRHTFAIEKLLAGASLEDVSLLLAHRSIKVTERHYLKFDHRRQQRLTAASMVDWDQIARPKPKPKSKPKLVAMKKAAGKT
jgi:site-specific recombinase XerD